VTRKAGRYFIEVGAFQYSEGGKSVLAAELNRYEGGGYYRLAKRITCPSFKLKDISAFVKAVRAMQREYRTRARNSS
jgi:hypothetical protein